MFVLILLSECGLPPEYCEWAPKDIDQEKCKEWLAEAHPDLYEKIFAKPEGEEESEEKG